MRKVCRMGVEERRTRRLDRRNPEKQSLARALGSLKSVRKLMRSRDEFSSYARMIRGAALAERPRAMIGIVQ